MNEALSAGALFSGIGGFCLGFERFGIPTVWAIENDAAAAKTYSVNVRGARVVTNGSEPADIKSVSVSRYDLEPVDVLHAGFPCQSFSQAGQRKGFDDPRGQLFYEVIRLIREFKDRKPSVLVLENAPYLRIGNGGRWFIEIMTEIRKAGYWFRESNACEIDTYVSTHLPQRRNRLFMVAFAVDRFRSGRFQFPSKRHEGPKDLSKFINFDGSVDDDSYYLPPDNRYYRMISKEKGDKTCIYQLRKYLVRVKDEGACPTLTANMGLGGHNVPFIRDAKGLRKLTEYECLKLQGFPETFIFPEEIIRYKRYMHVGNSVAVPIAELLAGAVKEKIQRERH